MAESRRYFSEIMNMGNDNEMDTEEDDEEKTRIYKEPMRRNLLDVFDKAMPIEITDERMSVFLRVRPFSTRELDSEENQGCVEVQNNYMVSANAPKDSHTFKAQLYGLNKAKHNFTFSRVFPETTSQKEFFDSTMLKLVQDFIEGQNCLVFTYGVTNSGKTYTIQGNARDAGILPRGLDVLFNSISGKQWPGMDLKPNMFCDVVKLSPDDEEKERKMKERTLKLNSSEDLDVMTLLGDDASDQSVMNATQQSDSSTTERKGLEDGQDALMAEVEDRDREEAAVDVSLQGQIRFSVWISFAEIYNEQIFDLLEPLPKKKDARRQILKLSEDRRGSPYIKGLKEINVTSADEAYKLLTIGQRNLKTACTKLNHCSSRSHCIFNIKIIRVPDKGNPKMARVSMLSLCDLAGSERHSKTHTTGERLKEAGNINTSLLTLGRCIELLRYNQLHKEKENKIIPFRESRLTRLFQNFFCGRGKAAMIVNVSQCASMFDETLNVFKFSAIAKQVVMPPKPVEKPVEPKSKRTTKTTRASSICWETSATPSRSSRASALPTEEDVQEEGEEEDDDLYIEHLEETVEQLENRVREMKHERLLREAEIRKEVCQEMQEQFVQIEDTYSMLLKETRRQEAERFEKKLQLIMDSSKPQPSKKPRLDKAAPSSSKDVMLDDDDEWVSSLLLHQEKVKVQEREASLAEMRGRVTELEFQVADLTRRNKDLDDRATRAEEAHKQLEAECAQKMAQAESLREAAEKDAKKAAEDLGHSVLLETLSQQLQAAKDRMKEQEKEISDLNEMLTDAGETFHQKEEEIAKLRHVIAEDEEKAEQQMETIRELRSLLEESKTAVEESEKRLEAKNRSIGDMKEELVHLEQRLKEDRKGAADPSDALKKCEEELAIARNRLKHEEEDFQQREKALIHGYTAEINNLKSQMALLKSQRNLGKCVATSPMRVGTPDKSRSPSRARLRKAGRKRKEAEQEEESAHHHGDLVHRLVEIANDSSLSAQLRQQLKDLEPWAEWLQQQARERSEAEGRLQQTQQDLEELQRQFTELSSASTELQRQLDRKKELHTELTDNQSESAELRQKLRIAESSTEDLETRLMAASQQKLAAEASKSQLVQELKETKDLLQQTEVTKKECESELWDLQKAMQSMTDTNTQLTTDCDSYRMMVDAHQTKMETAAEEKELLQDNLKKMQDELTERQQEAERAMEKKEELQMVVDELKSMLSQVTSELEAKTAQLKTSEKQSEGSDEMTSSNEAMLKAALSEANSAMQEESRQRDALQTQLEQCQTSIAQLEASLKESESREAELKTLLETKQEELTAQADKVDSYMREVESLKAELSTALSASQTTVSQVETLQAELEMKRSRVTALQSEVSSLKEAHQQQVKELKDNITTLQTTVDDNLSSDKLQLQGKEDLLGELRTNVATLEAKLQEKEKEIAELSTTVETVESKIAEKEKLLTEVTSAKDEALKKSSELEEQQKSLQEAKQAWEEAHQQLQERVQDADQRLKESQGELETLRAAHDTTEGRLREREARCSQLEKELQCSHQVLADLRQQESARLTKLQSLEKAQKEARRLQDRKLGEAREALEGRVKEVAELKASFSRLQEKNSQAGALQAELSQTAVQIAELRSRLHMEQALTHKHKASAEQVSEENTELEKRVNSVSQELEQMQKEKAQLTEEVTSLKARVSELETANAEAVKKFETELSEYKASNEALTAQHQEAVEGKQSLEQSSEKIQSEREALEKRVKELEQEGEKLRESYNNACAQLTQTNTNINKLEQCKHTLEEKLAVQVSVEPAKDSADSEELKNELEAEKSKNSEFQKQIKALCALDTATDAPGSSRRLRKEKIQAESDLANARLETERLQRQVERLLKARETNTPTPTPVVKCADCLNNRAKQEGGDAADVKSLRQNLSEKERRLNEAETVRQRVECELLEVKAKLLNTETDLTELKTAAAQQGASLGQSESSGKMSASASSWQEAYSILQGELEKSQAREASLRQELESGARVMDTEKQAQLQEQLAQKTVQLERSLQREKETCSLSVTELQAELFRVRQQRKIAVEDAKENERVIQQLKDAMLEQEETMERQDTIISQKDQEVQSLTTELEKLTDRYTKLHEQQSESSRELCNLTRQLVRVEEEKKAMSRDLADLQQKLKKVSEESRQVQERLTNLTTENSRLKDSVTKEGQSTVSLQDKLAATEKELSQVKKAYEKDTKIYLAKDEERTTLKEKVQTLELEIKHMQDKYKTGDEERQRWREQRDQMLGQLETLMTQQAQENKALKAQLHDDGDRYDKLLEQERTEKQELKRQLKVLQRAKDSVLADLRHGNHQLQVELAHVQGQEPPPALPPPQHHSFRVNDSDLVDDIDTTGHLEVDATPPVAAKGLRKGRKRASALNHSSSSGSGRSRKPGRKQQDSGMEVLEEAAESPEKSVPSRLHELEERPSNSPLTRSAKKLLKIISPERKPSVADQENKPVVTTEETSSQRRGRRKIIKEEVEEEVTPSGPPPFDCAPFQPSAMQTRKSSRLRERHQGNKQQSTV
ncbi:uncharacterized protein LOC143287590 [Babylonia areolata]|uniref:uncharacterized protein LOC143287590 n=1 Tax=Babylonia areolata TaxID=304850 RepID=UPI003FD570A4